MRPFLHRLSSKPQRAKREVREPGWWPVGHVFPRQCGLVLLTCMKVSGVGVVLFALLMTVHVQALFIRQSNVEACMHAPRTNIPASMHACMHACMRTSGHLLYTHMHASGTPPPLRVYVCEYGCIPCSRLWKQMRSGVWHICATGRTSLDSRCAVDTCIGCHGVGGGRCGKEVCRLGSALVNFGILQTAGEYERWQARGLFRGRSYVPTWLAHVACNIQVTVLSNMGSSSTKPS